MLQLFNGRKVERLKINRNRTKYYMERMEVNMKVAVMRDLNKMAFTKRPIPQPKEDEVLMGAALDKEFSFKTIFCYRHIYPIAIEAVASGKVNI